jgi:hypothetical protein
MPRKPLDPRKVVVELATAARRLQKKGPPFLAPAENVPYSISFALCSLPERSRGNLQPLPCMA